MCEYNTSTNPKIKLLLLLTQHKSVGKLSVAMSWCLISAIKLLNKISKPIKNYNNNYSINYSNYKPKTNGIVMRVI